MFRFSRPAVAALVLTCFSAPPVPALEARSERLPVPRLARFVPPPMLEERTPIPDPLRAPPVSCDFDVIAAQGTVTILVHVAAPAAALPQAAVLVVDGRRMDEKHLGAGGHAYLQAVVPVGAREACASVLVPAGLPRDLHCETLPQDSPILERFGEGPPRLR